MAVSDVRLRWLYLSGPVWWTGLAFSLFGPVVAVVTHLLLQEERAFQGNAARAVATVTGKESHLERKPAKPNTNERVHVLDCTFQDDAGRTHQAKIPVGLDEWQRVNKGDTKTIEYDRTNPSINRPAGEPVPPSLLLLIFRGVGVLFTTFGVVLLGVAFVSSARRVRVVRKGVAVLGTMDGVVEDASSSRGNTRFFRVAYRFVDDGGTTHAARGPAQSWSRVGGWQTGETILVLYDPANPERNEADIFQARSDDFARLQQDAKSE
jgi:hypothetical protein